VELLGLPMDAIPFIPLRVNVTPAKLRSEQYTVLVSFYRTCVSRLPPVSYRYKYCTGTGTVQYANVGVWYR
jgi:hypothetical protein